MDTIDVQAKYVVLSISTPRATASKVTSWNLSPGGNQILEYIDVLFAPGHAALTGVRFAYNGVTILPWNQPTAFILGDNERQRFDLGLYIAKPLVVTTTNTDNVVHVHQLTGKLRELPSGQQIQPVRFPTISA